MSVHDQYMQRCIQLAKLGSSKVQPNPLVGCVIVHHDRIVGEGYHAEYGGPHAEVNAFASLDPEVPVEECTVYVNLEPCSHHGKTPPCADLIVEKQPALVVVGMLDPNPMVAGSGVRRITEAGIDIEVGILEEENKELNTVFTTFHVKRRPYITLKWAQTSDGFMGRLPGDPSSKKISHPALDSYVHQLRAQHAGILVGAHTANTDDPLLNVRHWEGDDPIKIVLSRTGQVRNDLKLFKNPSSLVFTEERGRIIEGADVVCTPCDLAHVLSVLHSRNIASVLVEGGSEVLAEFIQSDLWDKAVVIVSDTTWESGVEAPVILQDPTTVEIRTDTLYTYIN